MSALDAGFSIVVAASAGLLVVAGIGKLRTPAPTRTVLASAGLPAVRVLTTCIGAVEIAVGIAALLTDARLVLALLAAAYPLFALVSLWQWRAGSLESCGCLGETTAPPGPTHVIVTSLLATALVAAAVFGQTQSARLLLDQLSATALASALALAALMQALVLTLTLLPGAFASWDPTRQRAPASGPSDFQLTIRKRHD
jgi:uncharacterized membrane protein YphA (DoxX/SURF4 family)